MKNIVRLMSKYAACDIKVTFTYAISGTADYGICIDPTKLDGETLRILKEDIDSKPLDQIITEFSETNNRDTGEKEILEKDGPSSNILRNQGIYLPLPAAIVIGILILGTIYLAFNREPVAEPEPEPERIAITVTSSQQEIVTVVSEPEPELEEGNGQSESPIDVTSIFHVELEHNVLYEEGPVLEIYSSFQVTQSDSNNVWVLATFWTDEGLPIDAALEQYALDNNQAAVFEMAEVPFELSVWENFVLIIPNYAINTGSGIFIYAQIEIQDVATGESLSAYQTETFEVVVD
jgi:hypothetical protein